MKPASRLRDRFLLLIARAASALSYRRWEVVGLERLPYGCPMLVVANHWNGFVDPVLVAASLRRFPHYLAKSTLWRIGPIRPLLWLGGLIPAYRSVDNADTSGNRRSFAVAHRVLRQRGVVGIFPEGTTHDEPRLAPVKTGAARIVLGARAEGATGIAMVPVGITYDDKLSLRSRVLVRVGEPILVDAFAEAHVSEGPGDDTDHVLVDALTTAIRDRLESVTLDYDGWWEHQELAQAADVVLREECGLAFRDVPLSEREALAQELAERPGPERAAVSDALNRYLMRLGVLGVRDRELTTGGLGWLATRLVLLAFAAVVLFAFLAVPVVVNALPAAIVLLVSVTAKVPVTRGTLRLLTGLVVFPAAWIAAALYLTDGWLPFFLLVALFVATAFVAVPVGEGIVRWWRIMRAYVLQRDRRWLVPTVLEARREVIRTVRGTADE